MIRQALKYKMQQALIEAVESALSSYQNQGERPGYPKRVPCDKKQSSFKGEQLLIRLQHTQSDIEAFNILTDILVDPSVYRGCYSLHAYLIDALKASSKGCNSTLQTVDWDCWLF